MTVRKKKKAEQPVTTTPAVPSSIFFDKYPLVYPLADALQMDLNLLWTGRRHMLDGQYDVSLDTLPGQETRFTVKVMASYVGKETAGVLLKIRKKLYAYIDFDKPRDVLYLSLIDAEKIGMNETNASQLFNDIPPAEASMKYENAIVAQFERPHRGETWVRVDDKATKPGDTDADTVGRESSTIQAPDLPQEGLTRPH